MYKYVKRIIDFILSIILIILLSPLMLIISISIKIDDNSGPIIFKQQRTGYKGKVFYLYKFRTMSQDNDVLEFNKENEITNFGKLLRKTSLDELPQLFNILKGEMSFIGPRPWIPKYFENFTELQKRRLDVLPGLTGLAQACGRNSISIFEKIRLDIKYVDTFSFSRDLKVIYWTIKTLFNRTGNDISKKGIEEEIEELYQNKMKTNNIKLDEYLNNTI